MGRITLDRSLVTLAVALLFWLAVSVVFHILNVNMLISDVAGYWRDTLTIRNAPGLSGIFLTDPAHIPGYPFLLAVVSALTQHTVELLTLMRIVNLIAWILAVCVLYTLFQAIALPKAALGVLVYAVFPFVGVIEAVWARADALMALAVLVALLAYVKGWSGVLILSLIAAMFFHKFAWPLTALIIVIGLWQKRIRWWMPGLIFAPLVLYWIAGAQVHQGNLLWLFGESISDGFTGGRQLPVFDGILGNFLTGSVYDFIQGVVLAITYVTCVVLLFEGSWQGEPVLLSILVMLIVGGALSNKDAIWGLMRTGKFLVLPLWVAIFRNTRLIRLRSPRVIYGAIGLGFITQIGFAFYIARVYFS